MKKKKVLIIIALFSIILYVASMIVVNTNTYDGLHGVYNYVFSVGIGGAFLQIVFSLFLILVDKKHVRTVSTSGIIVVSSLIILAICLFTLGAYNPGQ